MLGFYQRAALRARWSREAICPSGNNFPVVVYRGFTDMLTWVIEIIELNSGVRCFLRDCLDAAMASEEKHQHAGLVGHRPLVFSSKRLHVA